MTKAFLDVFPNLNITDELRELLNLVEVEKVTSTRDRSSIRVFIVSPSLIHKQNINIGELKTNLADQGVEIRVC